MKHKHAEYIKAWLDGETVEYTYGGKWHKVVVLNDFMIYDEFRKKPTQWYRVGLYKGEEGEYFTFSVNSEQEEVKDETSCASLVRWLTDRVYYEV